MNIYICTLLFLICAISPLHAQTGDLNNDNKVDFSDFLIFASNFGKEGEPGAECGSLIGDFNCDNKVDFTDFITFAGNFGTEGGGQTLPDAPDFHPPQTFADILTNNRIIAWSPHTQSLSNLTRISLGIDGTQDLLTLNDNDNTYAATLSLSSGLASSTAHTNNTLLKTMFQLIEVSSNTYKIVSTKHANYALDYDTITGTPTLIMRDTRSYFLTPTTAAYLTFSFTTSGSTTQITATGRYTYNTSTSAYEADNTWTEMNVAISGTSVILTNQTGTSWTLYQAPINLNIPTDFNPTNIARVSNGEFLPSSDGQDRLTGSLKDVLSTYQAQVTSPGLNDATTTAADAMLATIDSTLAAEGATLRYPIAFYKVVREHMLLRSVQVSDMYDAKIGDSTVPYVYFTNEADDSGAHHPFMVIATFGIPEGMALLWDVPRPPGDGTPGTQYPDQQVTRNATKQNYFVKIPMKNYGQIETLTENTLTDNLATDVMVSLFTYLNYTSVSGVGVALDGVIIYPSLNNTLAFAQEAGEIASTGMHSGRGLGTHYHADSHSATGNGFNLYNATDYEGHTHPPIVSLSFDGVAGYGKYLPNDTTSDGVNEPLDEWGGHSHGDYGYHYHTETSAQTTTAPGSNNETFTAHMLPPRGAWRGKIDGIPQFWDNRSPHYGGRPGRYHGMEER